MQIEIPDQTAEELKAMLAQQGEDCDLQQYIQRTLSKRLLHAAVGELRAQTATSDQRELSDTIDEVIRQVRTNHREQKPDEDCP